MTRRRCHNLIFFLCGLFLVGMSGIGLRLYFVEWRQSALSSGALKQGAAPGKRAKARPPSAPEKGPAVVDLNSYLVGRNEFYRNLPAQSLQKRRIEDQEKLLDGYEKDPETFLKQYVGNDQIFLFDAVIDAKNMVRVGTFSDGGKWMSDPESLNVGAVVYSFGAGTEISFDADVAGLFGCEVHCFDPTPSLEPSFANCSPGQAVGKGKFWFYPIGLGPVSLDPKSADDLILEGQECQVKRLSELAAERKHDRVDILKIDIEGGEMAALTEILASGTLGKLGVKQLFVEFHLWDDQHWGSFVHIINHLRHQGYLIFRKEFNPWNARCAEFSFLSTT